MKNKIQQNFHNYLKQNQQLIQEFSDKRDQNLSEVEFQEFSSYNIHQNPLKCGSQISIQDQDQLKSQQNEINLVSQINQDELINSPAKKRTTQTINLKFKENQQQSQENVQQQQQNDKNEVELDNKNVIKQNFKISNFNSINFLKKVAGKWKLMSSISKLKMLKSRHIQYFNDKTLLHDKKANLFIGQDYNDQLNQLDQSLFCMNFASIKQYIQRQLQVPIQLTQISVLNPSHPIIMIQELVILLIIAIYFYLIPLIICFDSTLIGKEYIITTLIFLIIDIIFQLNTSFYYKGVCNNSRHSILVNYLYSKFFIDIIALIPLILFLTKTIKQDDNTSTESREYYLFLFFVKYFQLNQIKQKFEERFYQKKTLMHILSLIKLILIILYISHIFACIWIYFSQLEFQFQFTDKNWINQQKVSSYKSQLTLYLYAYYFMITTMTTVGKQLTNIQKQLNIQQGFGDITPQNEIEAILIIFTMLVGTLVFGYSINSVGNILNQLSIYSNQLKETLFTINNYMEKKNISQNLQCQIREYLQYYMKQEYQNNTEIEEKIICMLSNPLKKQLQIEANKIILNDSPIFKNNFSQKIIQNIVPIIQEYRCTPDERVYSFGDYDDNSIFFVESGKVEIYIQNLNKINNEFDSNQIQILDKGQCFGEREFFTGQYRLQNIRSLDFTTLLKISRQDFIKLLQEFPEDFEKFCYIKDEIIFSNSFSKIGKSCSSCAKYDHQIDECPLIHYVPNKLKVQFKIQQIQQNFFYIYKQLIIKDNQSINQEFRLQLQKERKIKKFNSKNVFQKIQPIIYQFIENNINYFEQCEWWKDSFEDIDEDASEEDIQSDSIDQQKESSTQNQFENSPPEFSTKKKDSLSQYSQQNNESIKQQTNATITSFTAFIKEQENNNNNGTVVQQSPKQRYIQTHVSLDNQEDLQAIIDNENALNKTEVTKNQVVNNQLEVRARKGTLDQQFEEYEPVNLVIQLDQQNAILNNNSLSQKVDTNNTPKGIKSPSISKQQYSSNTKNQEENIFQQADDQHNSQQKSNNVKPNSLGRKSLRGKVIQDQYKTQQQIQQQVLQQYIQTSSAQQLNEPISPLSPKLKNRALGNSNSHLPNFQQNNSNLDAMHLGKQNIKRKLSILSQVQQHILSKQDIQQKGIQNQNKQEDPQISDTLKLLQNMQETFIQKKTTNKEEEFDEKRDFKFYYPQYNSANIIQLLNNRNIYKQSARSIKIKILQQKRKTTQINNLYSLHSSQQGNNQVKNMNSLRDKMHLNIKEDELNQPLSQRQLLMNQSQKVMKRYTFIESNYSLKGNSNIYKSERQITNTYLQYQNNQQQLQDNINVLGQQSQFKKDKEENVK